MADTNTINELYITYDEVTGNKVNINDVDSYTTITNDKIHYEQFKLTESICSDSDLKFGGCEASTVELKITNFQNELEAFLGKWLTIYFVFKGTTERKLIGYFRVESDKLTKDKQHRNITAFNSMYYINNVDVSEWYSGLVFPITIKNLRDSLFRRLGYTQVKFDSLGQKQTEFELINDNRTVEITTQYNELFAVDVLQDICEVNGCFGRINSDDEFEYVTLENTVSGGGEVGSYKIIDKSDYRRNEFESEDYTVQSIDSVRLSQNNGNDAVWTTAGTNSYYCDMRVLSFQKITNSTLNEIANTLHNNIRNKCYAPFKIVAEGNLSFQCGDAVRVNFGSGGYTISYILQRTLEGIQVLKDTYSADGKREYERTKSGSSGYIGSEQKSNTDEFYVLTFTNSDEYNIAGGYTEAQLEQNSEQTIINYLMATTRKTDILFNATIPIDLLMTKDPWFLRAQYDANAVITYYLDGVQEGNSITQYITQGHNVITLTNFFHFENAQVRRLEVKIKLASMSNGSIMRTHHALLTYLYDMEWGSGYHGLSIDFVPIPDAHINEKAIRSAIFGKGLVDAPMWDGKIEVTESFAPIKLSKIRLGGIDEDVKVELKKE